MQEKQKEQKENKSDMSFVNISGVNTPTMTNFKLPNVKSLNRELGRDTQLHIVIYNVYH